MIGLGMQPLTNTRPSSLDYSKDSIEYVAKCKLKMHKRVNMLYMFSPNLTLLQENKLNTLENHMQNYLATYVMHQGNIVNFNQLHVLVLYIVIYLISVNYRNLTDKKGSAVAQW